uniref:Limbic system associated membrane protein n=1 Tax=Ornithorhynchus anatinus TaxID=9258 RepID=F6XH78_ORNAN
MEGRGGGKGEGEAAAAPAAVVRGFLARGAGPAQRQCLGPRSGERGRGVSGLPDPRPRGPWSAWAAGSGRPGRGCRASSSGSCAFSPQGSRCAASTSPGAPTTSPSDRATPPSSVPPKISNISSDVTVNEGSNVTLVCMASGRPEPVISWRHLTPTGREYEGEEEYLEILGITREQSGKYECRAANDVALADVKQVKVTVNYPPTITESKSNEASTGRPASLTCEAAAVPAPDFEWYRDDTRINSASGLEIRSVEGQSLLTVSNVTEEHYGNYTCVAANKLGVTNASLVLFKRVLPTIPHPNPEIGTTVHFKQTGPGSVRGINGTIALTVPLWLLAASLLCLLSKC